MMGTGSSVSSFFCCRIWASRP